MEVFKLGAEAMGYRTITIPWDEVHGSLQNGFAEGVYGMTPAAAYTILKDVIKYWYDLRHSVENLNYMMSLKTWEKLSEEDRGIIQNACAKISAVSVYLAEKDQEKYLQSMRDAGIEVHTYTPEELAPLFVKVSATWDKLAERFSQELIDEFKKEFARQ
jgi:TRAP-type C4-dicarboxylate transport system substrate-binding protein